MATPRVRPDLQPSLLSRLQESRARTDALFALLPPNSFYARPVPERHRLIFYLGHLEAFDWNLLSWPLSLKSQEPAFDKLFAFGIDPVGSGLPTDRPGDWPNIARVEKYASAIRERLDESLERIFRSESAPLDDSLADGVLLNVAIEHRLMHAETLSYLLHNLPLERKTPHPGPGADLRPSPCQKSIRIPAGYATLGQRRTGTTFGWDNEFEEEEVLVPPFSIDAYPVTNAEFMKFVRAGGYESASYWEPDDWKWVREFRIEHPHFWAPRSSSPATDPDTQWEYRAMFSVIPLPQSWPVYVSYAEANAYANWKRRALPSEAQWHRAAYGAADGSQRAYPWGGAPPESARGNFHFERWDPIPVDAHPAGASAFGVYDLLGNGWEWTRTPFGPLPGFEPFAFYRGYSADFFDGRHFVMKGGSPRTDACMLRRAFRNWFQPHYPYVYATFRCVEE